ncbi:hypothetical protein G9U51_07915 [Calidifontibacter sp. DB0510]|uniref:Uncharacterized protein n=1 Tax=Metallococcus carri TaxID=1656884 RepID=A0A967B1J5_9MICO|nr:hypothetical protein [Metallococcus carri]NHN55700.1 hypothetical protein [Metallococcus carri]NOP38611.1 hypothetical protein [Calidifontibacter sp. DB2511S]
MTTKKWNIEPEWQEPFVAALTRRGADGHAINGALSGVDQECLAKGKPARELFGDPEKYAEGIVLPGTQAAKASRARAIVLQIVGLIGMFLTLWGWTGMRRQVDSLLGMSPVVPFVIGLILTLGAAITDVVLGSRADVYALDPGQKPTGRQLFLNKIAPWLIVLLTLVGMLIIWARYS